MSLGSYRMLMALLCLIGVGVTGQLYPFAQGCLVILFFGYLIGSIIAKGTDRA